jgi:hypothetical protein
MVQLISLAGIDSGQDVWLIISTPAPSEKKNLDLVVDVLEEVKLRSAKIGGYAILLWPIGGIAKK